MSAKMTKAPAFYVLTQVRFNSILALDSYAAKIQDEFRKHGFPDLERIVVPTFNLNIGLGPMPAGVPVVNNLQYHFTNIDRTARFVLLEGALSFETTRYEVFETFSKSLLRGLSIVDEAVGGLSYTDRIGYRYVNAVVPAPGEDLQDYLKKHVLGLYGETGGAIVQAFSESIIRQGEIGVTARSFIKESNLLFPPDLGALTLNLSDTFSTVNGLHAMLDTDGYFEKREAFGLSTIEDRLKSIHEALADAFRTTVTDQAIEKWS